jgi:hypothetical protein
VKQSRRCKFCGIGKVTKEHVIPQSWGSILDGGLSDVPGHTLWYVHRVYDPVGSGENVTLTDEKRAKTPAFISRNFCKGCQGGWMRQLDEAVLGLVPRLTPTTSVRLDVEQQRALARWAAKTMMVYLTKETDERQREFGVVADFRRFGENRGPLPGTHVWIGVRRHDDPGWFRSFSAPLRTRTGDTCDAYGAVLTVGHLATVTIVPASAELAISVHGDDAAAMKPIWPVQVKPVQWPPLFQINPRDPTRLIASMTSSAVVTAA